MHLQWRLHPCLYLHLYLQLNLHRESAIVPNSEVYLYVTDFSQVGPGGSEDHADCVKVDTVLTFTPLRFRYKIGTVLIRFCCEDFNLTYSAVNTI